MINRRGFIGLVLAVLFFGFVAGVAFSEGSQEGGDEQVSLTWGMWSATDTETAQWQELADDVTARYPNIEVQLETTGWTAYWARLQTQLASNTQPDVNGMQSLRAYGYYSLGGFQSLSPFIEEDDEIEMADYDPFMIEALSYGGEVYGLPYDAVLQHRSLRRVRR
jgi:ABC-type glycerol-3-phosphate transport system substrate-binding protein